MGQVGTESGQVGKIAFLEFLVAFWFLPMVLLILPMLPAMLGQHAADAGDLTDGLSLGSRDEVAHHVGDEGAFTYYVIT